MLQLIPGLRRSFTLRPWIKKCEFCQKEFRLSQSKPRGKFCSRSCSNARLTMNWPLQYRDDKPLRQACGTACNICGVSAEAYQQRFQQKLALDHDTQTKLLRGFLCFSCNTALGGFGHDPVRLERAATYLRRNLSSLNIRTRVAGAGHTQIAR